MLFESAVWKESSQSGNREHKLNVCLDSLQMSCLLTTITVEHKNLQKFKEIVYIT